MNLAPLGLSDLQRALFIFRMNANKAGIKPETKKRHLAALVQAAARFAELNPEAVSPE
jgi:hypothetical protein